MCKVTLQKLFKKKKKVHYLLFLDFTALRSNINQRLAFAVGVKGMTATKGSKLLKLKNLQKMA